MTHWPHAPSHGLSGGGAYMVTSGTYGKQPFFNSGQRLNLLQANLFDQASGCGAALQAWAIFPNHYHFIAAFEEPRKLRDLVRGLHSVTAKRINEMDGSAGRKIWFQYWESRITFERSYFSRLRYVHENAVHHGIARVARNYPWCSAAWFERTSSPGFRKTVLSFGCSRLPIPDDFAMSTEQVQSE
jgi:putative transposase